MKIFVTGSESFIGKELIKLAQSRGIEAVGVDLLKGVDVTKPEVVDFLPEAIDAVVHLAAISTAKKCQEDVRRCFEVNVLGTLNLIEAARKKGAKRFIFPSTEWVYGENNSSIEMTEETPINLSALDSEYALSKAISEINLRQEFKKGLCPVTILRLAIVYGPRPDGWVAVESLFHSVKNDSSLRVGSLKTGRRFIHVTDVAEAILAVLEKNEPGLEIYNVGFDHLITLQEIIETSTKLWGKEVWVFEENYDKPIIRNPSNKKIRERLGWQPKIDLVSGLKTLENFENKPPAIKLTERPCPLCGEKDNQPLFKQRFERWGADYVVSECLGCGFIFQNPAWGKEAYDNLYASHVYDPTGHKFYPAQVERYRIVAETIAGLANARPGAALLDYGCYDGSFIEWLKSSTTWASDWQLVGYDIFLKNVPVDGSFYNSLDELRTKGKKFDVAVMNHALEHLFDPLGAVRFIKEHLLKDNGYLVVESPDLSFIRKDDISPAYVQHTNYFTPESLVRLGKLAGLATLRVQSFKNEDIKRDPNHPSLLVVFEKNPDFIESGLDLTAAVAKSREALKNKVAALGNTLKVAVVGCGDYLFPALETLGNQIEVVGLFDNNKELWGQALLNQTVRPVEEIVSCPCQAYLVCTLNQHNTEQIKAQLSELVDRDKIITLLND